MVRDVDCHVKDNSNTYSLLSFQGDNLLYLDPHTTQQAVFPEKMSQIPDEVLSFSMLYALVNRLKKNSPTSTNIAFSSQSRCYTETTKGW